MTIDDSSQKVSEFSRRLEELRSELKSNPANASEILSDALENLRSDMEDLQITEKVLKRQNKEYIRSGEESADVLAHALHIYHTALEMQNEELSQAKLKIHEALVKYSDLYDLSPIGLFTLNTQGQILEANLAGAKLLGMAHDRLINKCFRHFVSVKDYPLFDDLCKSAFENPATQTCELSLVKYEGSTIYVHIEGSTNDGSLTDKKSLRIAIIDITEHKQADIALQESKNYLDKIINSVSDSIFAIDRQHRFVLVNDAKCKLLGLSREDIIGKTAYDLFSSKETADIYWENDEKVFETGIENVNEETISFANGIICTVVAKKTLYTDNAGNQFVVGIAQDITERMKAEDALRESEEKFKSLSDASPVAILVYQGNRHVYANPAAELICGYTRDELSTMNYFDFIHPDCRDRIKRMMQARMRGESTQSRYEAKIITRAGEEKWLDISSNPVHYEGLPARMIISIDITDRKQGEAELLKAKDGLEQRVAERTAELKSVNIALETSRDYLDTIINSIGDPVHVKDRQHRLVLVNDAACRLFGHSKEDLIGKTAYELFPTKETADTSWRKDEEVFRTGVENVNEETNTYAPGKTRVVLVKKTLFTDMDGNRFLVGITTDITKLKQAQEQIRFQASLLDQVNNAVIATDLNGNIIYWNKSAETLLQWTSEEIRGRNIADTLVPEDKLDQMKYVISDLIAGGSYNGELDVRKKDGSIVPTYHSFCTIKNDKGDLIGIAGVAVDITERKRAQEELERAKEDAEAAARSKSEFLANMSHEIRTPMNAVIGLTDLLQRTDLNQEQRDYIEIIRNSGESLLSVINNLLDFSKIDSGKIKLESQPFNLKELVEDSLNLIATEASKKSLNLSYNIDPSTPELIIGDRAKLRQILINLLSNAVKFTDKGEVSFNISWEKLESNDLKVHFAVKDTGIGIPEDKIGYLFQPFSQVNASTTRIYSGTGLGLAISRRLVELMGGGIWAESEDGKGSTFHFTILARATTIKPSDKRIITQQPQADLQSGQLPVLRILLAEDNPVNRKVALQMLHKIGYEADVAANGFEVLQALERQTYDIILMDVQMPEMDGIEAAKKIREQWHVWPKIIAITAYALEGDMDRCLEAGMDDYISKPIQLDDLQIKIIKWGANKEESKTYS